MRDENFVPELILDALQRHQVEYLMVGGMAALAYGAERPTNDLDCLPRSTAENCERVAAALRELNARLRVGGMTDEESQASWSTTDISQGSMYSDGMAGTILAELRAMRSEIIGLARARGASRVRVVGSVARGEATAVSDVDFLVDLDPDRSLFDLGGLVMDLQELLEREVDVVTEIGLRPRVAHRVLVDAVEL